MTNCFQALVSHVMQAQAPKNNSAIQSPADFLMLLLVLLIIVVFLVVMFGLIHFWTVGLPGVSGKSVPENKGTLTPTQRFILAASSATLGNEYKCVIDIWGTRDKDTGRQKAKELFTWGWGAHTRENAVETAQDMIERGLSPRYRIYCGIDTEEARPEPTEFEIGIFEEVRQRFPEQGTLAWDLVRALSVVGGAYMSGIMEYDEAAGLALEACRKLQQNFSSWDEVAENYTLGYQLWRGKRMTDRLRYYKRLKKTWIYDIPWDTVLKEEEL